MKKSLFSIIALTFALTLVWSTNALAYGGGGQGGSPYHSECVSGQCKYVQGSGANQCYVDSECVGQGYNNNTNSTNQNNNGNNTNRNINGNTNTNSANMNVNTNTNSGGRVEFQDITGHWAERSIRNLQSTCQLLGFDENNVQNFKPDLNITRAELVVLLIKCRFGVLDPVSVAPFNDVSTSHWAASYLARGKALGWISGYLNQSENGMFKPERTISREEAAKIIARAFYPDTDIIGASTTKFTDVKLTEWYAKYVTFMESRGYMEGFGELFGIGRNMTRGEAVQTIDRAN